MPTGATEWVDVDGPVFAGSSGGPAGGGPIATEPAGATYVRVAPSEGFDTNQIPIAATAVRVVAAEGVRRTIRFRNYGSSDVFIGQNQTDLLGGAGGTGWPLKADETLLLETSAEVWAVCATGDSTTLALIAEYEVPVVS